MADNSALRARQRPIRPLGASQEGGAKGGRVTQKRSYVSVR